MSPALRALFRPIASVSLLGLLALSACKDGGGNGSDTDIDGDALAAFEGLYEVTSWSDDPQCGGGETPFPPFAMRLALDGDVWTQTPCASADSCDIPNDLWATDVDGAGPDGLREVEDAAYNESADGCQLFYNKRELTFSGTKATFDRSTISAAYQANGNTDEACAALLADWDRTGDKGDCTAWEGTLIAGSGE